MTVGERIAAWVIVAILAAGILTMVYDGINFVPSHGISAKN